MSRSRFLLASSLFIALGCPSSDGDSGTDGATESTSTTQAETSTTTGTTGETTSDEEPVSSSESSSSGTPPDPTSSGETDPATTGAGTTTSGSTGDAASSSGSEGDGSQVVVETNMGNIVIQLELKAAPVTTSNFIAYVEAGFYDGTDGLEPTIFHRVIPGFVIQGGGLTPDLDRKATMPAIINEHFNGLTNDRGTLSMARTNDPNSATSQFFINVVDNPNLDTGDGYAVFGSVIEGMDVVDMIVAVETEDVPPFEDVPVEDVIMTSVYRR